MSTCCTQTIVSLPQPEMAGLPQRRTRTKPTASPFRFSNGANYPNGSSGFSFLQSTVPSQGSHSQFWNGTGEGQQYLHQNPTPQGQNQHGVTDSFIPFHVSQDTHGSQETVQRSLAGPSRSDWNVELPATHLPTQDPLGGQSQGTQHSFLANSYDQTRSTSMYQNHVQVSSPMSSASSDGTGRSHSPDHPSHQVDSQTFVDGFPYHGTDVILGDQPEFHRSTQGLVTSSFHDNVFATSGSDAFFIPADPVSQDPIPFNPNPGNETSTFFDSYTILESQRSTPSLLEDSYNFPNNMVTSTHSPLGYSSPHSVESLSPERFIADMAELPSRPAGTRVTKKVGPRQSKVNSDTARTRTTGIEVSDDSSKYGPGKTLDVDNNARDHELYLKAAPGPDNLYHCPWEGQDGCTHKPEKLKCNYDKFVDSHLKPYRCKVVQCENLQFSSTACLLRHEREAHAMHGHGEKPFLCTYEGCDRGVIGNGFPRHWNLRDHMKRVHNDAGPPKDLPKSNEDFAPASGPVRGKKRKQGDKSDSPPMPERIEKASKRAASPVEKLKLEPKGPTALESYQKSHQTLLNIIQNLQDPTAPNNNALFREASNHFRTMCENAKVINAFYPQQSG